MSYTGSMQFGLAHTYCGSPFEHRLPIRPTIIAYLTHHANTHGNDPFITAVSSSGGMVTLSYYELDMFSRRLACWLRRASGVCAGDVVALLPANDVLSVIVI